MPNKKSAMGRRLSPAAAEKVLMPGDSLSVVEVGAGMKVRNMFWPRSRVLATIAQYGWQLSGPLAREAKHGIAVETESGCLFMETAHD